VRKDAHTLGGEDATEYCLVFVVPNELLWVVTSVVVRLPTTPVLRGTFYGVAASYPEAMVRIEWVRRYARTWDLHNMWLSRQRRTSTTITVGGSVETEEENAMVGKRQGPRLDRDREVSHTWYM
jgi:hypothetical protein